MVSTWILALFAGLAAATAVSTSSTYTNQSIPSLTGSTTHGGSTYSFIPFIWTNTTTLSSTTIVSTVITQNTTSNFPVPPADPSTVPLEPNPASPGISSVLPANHSSAAPSSTGVSSPTSSGTSAAITSTLTSIPPGLMATTLPGTSYTANDWITTTDGSHQTTLLPVIAAGGGLGIVFWNLPPIPDIEFALPGFPKFHLPCIKIFGITIGSCTSPPVTDGPITDNSPANSPTDSVISSTTTADLACTTTEPVPSCIQTCSTIIQTGGLTTTSCAAPSCTTIQACSATITTSTVFETPTPFAACFFGGPTSQNLSSAIAGPTSCSLTKRTVLVPGNFESINLFLDDQLDIAAANGNLLELRGTGTSANGGLSSSKRFQFLDTPFLTGATEQRGCTTVYIFSKQGMWEAHFWEIPAFQVATEVVNGIVTKTAPSRLEDFNSDVINFIGDGDGPQNPGITQDTGPGGLFATDILSIFIVTPKLLSSSPAGVLRYPVQAASIRQQVQKLLRVDNSIPIFTTDYVALGPKVPNREFRFGTVLIQYDPQQSPAGADQTTALVRVYVDGIAFPDMTWNPLPNQVPQIGQAAGQAAKRDLEQRDGGCTVSEPSPTPTTLSTSTIPATESSQATITSPSVPMSYGIVFGTDCLQTTTVTSGLTSPVQYCESLSFTYSSWTSWATTTTPANPGNSLGLLECASLSYSGSRTICVPGIASDISAINSIFSGLASDIASL